MVGATPLTVQFSAANSKDYDDEELRYEWFFTGEDVQSNEVEPTFTFSEPGIYQVELRVTDSTGEQATTYQKIIAGNAPPTLSIELDEKDNMFYKGKEIAYKVVVADLEDGSTAKQEILSLIHISEPTRPY